MYKFCFSLGNVFRKVAVKILETMSLNILEIVSHEWNKECDTAVFKHHRISAFVTAIVSTKEFKLVAVLPDL